MALTESPTPQPPYLDVRVAKASDLAVVVVGDNVETTREAWADNHLGVIGPNAGHVELGEYSGTSATALLFPVQDTSLQKRPARHA